MTGAARRRALIALLALLAALPVAQAFGWGAAGHRIVGAVADELLDAASRAKLVAIAGDQSLAELGLALDRDKRELEERLPGSSRWHFDNRPDCGRRVPPASYCPDGACASVAYARYRAILADHRASAAERLFALKVVVHVLADIHQPLHVADHGDRGGNSLEVALGRGRHPKPLHTTWDNDFVKRAMHGERQDEFVRELIAEHAGARARIGAGSAGDWMEESWRLAHDYAFGRLPGFACAEADPRFLRLSDDYADGAARIVREQLARAGIRLAAELKAAL